MTSPGTRPTDISPQMAEQYMSLLDLLGEIDLRALDEQIARLIRLRDMIRRVQGTPEREPDRPASVPSVPQDSVSPINRPKKGDLIKEARRMCDIALTDAPKSVTQIAGSDDPVLWQRVHRALKDMIKAGRCRRVPNTSPIQYELVPKEPAREPLTAVV